MPDAATAITQPPPTHPARAVPTLATRIAVIVNAVDRLLADITAANEPDSDARAVEADPDLAAFDRLQLARAELLRAAAGPRAANREASAARHWLDAQDIETRHVRAAVDTLTATLVAALSTERIRPGDQLSPVTAAGEMWP